ncbi:pentapeptide repeat-containing protein [Pseudomonas sp. W3I7]|uniref:pentapeptide repeat-containing protein n=1 Tax=Pseudomonas sp. W3I7 TaxID=3042292 RepID=UPI00359320B7
MVRLTGARFTGTRFTVARFTGTRFTSARFTVASELARAGARSGPTPGSAFVQTGCGVWFWGCFAAQREQAHSPQQAYSPQQARSPQPHARQVNVHGHQSMKP